MVPHRLAKWYSHHGSSIVLLESRMPRLEGLDKVDPSKCYAKMPVLMYQYLSDRSQVL